MGINRKNPNPYRSVFLKSHNGSLVIEHAEKPTDEDGNPIEKAYLRPHKTKGEIWCEPIWNIVGYICNIEVTDFTITLQNDVELTIENVEITLGDLETGEQMVLSELLGSKQANSIFYCLPNIDANLETKIFARSYQENTYLSILQLQENNTRWRAAKNIPKGDPNYEVPPLEMVKFKGKEQWDDTARNEFFKAELAKWKDKFADALESNREALLKARQDTPNSAEDKPKPEPHDKKEKTGTEDLDSILEGVKDSSVKSDENVGNLVGEKAKRRGGRKKK